MKAYWFVILDRWKQLGWVPPLPTLDRHLEHILGGMAFAWIATMVGFEPLGAVLISCGLSTLIEGLTAIFKGNWKDSIFDWFQYQFVWIVFMLPDVVGFSVGLLVYVLIYFILLLKEW